MAPTPRGRTTATSRVTSSQVVTPVRRRRRVLARCLVAALASACAVGLTPLAASADPTPAPSPTSPDASSSPGASGSPAAAGAATGRATLTLAVFDTDVVLVGGDGFTARSSVTLDAEAGDLGGTAGIDTDAQGRFVAGFQLPGGFNGTVSLSATGPGGLTASGTLPVSVPLDTDQTPPGTPSSTPGSTAGTTPPASTPPASTPSATPAGTPSPAATTPTTPTGPSVSTGLAGLTGALSGLPWASGAYNQPVLNSLQNFGSWRGRPADVALLYTIRSSWDGLVKPDWPVNTFAGYQGRLILSQPTFPQGQGNNAACAAGQYNSKWSQLGTYLVQHNRADTIVRIGWEFNGTFMYWHTDADPTNFRNCFRQISQSIKSTDPKVLIDWTFNAHASPVPSSGNPYDAYPGDDVVDLVGIDDYDHFPPSRDQVTWDKQCNDVNGLCHLITFARAHGKKVSVGEWGVTSCSGNGGGDNPFYIQKMYDTFKANADVMGYEAYFNDTAPGNVCSSIVGGGSSQNPKASSLYKTLFGASA